MKKVEKVWMFITSVLMGITLVMLGSVTYFKVKYPFGYDNLVRFYSNQYNLDANLVRAIIKTESGFNNLAVSSVGAVGLMQIMPDTAIWIAQEIGVDNFQVKMLYEPEINIKFGCFYLNYLFNKYENKLKVLFSYNAGEGTMLKLYEADDFINLNSISIIETENYIKNVLKCEGRYIALSKLSKTV